MKDMDREAAEGVEIRLADGRSLMDFSAGLGVAALGHNHPRIIEAERKCHKRMVIDCIKLAPHKLQGALSYNLPQYLPDTLKVAFLSVSGSEPNKDAMKLCARTQLPKRTTTILCNTVGCLTQTHHSLHPHTHTVFQGPYIPGVLRE